MTGERALELQHEDGGDDRAPDGDARVHTNLFRGYNRAMGYRSPRALARFAKVGIVLVLLAQALLLLAIGAEAAVLGVPIEQAPPEDPATGLVGLGMCCSGLTSIGALIASATVFLMWLHRAYSGAQAMGAMLSYSPGYAVGSWFIPFINCVVPMQVVQALDVASARDVELESTFRSPDIVVWWVLWLGSNFIGTVSARLAEHTGTTAALVIECGVLLMRIGAAVLLIRIIGRITDNLDRKANALMPGAVPTAPLTF